HRLSRVMDDGFGNPLANWVTNAGIVYKGSMYFGVGSGAALSPFIDNPEGASVVRSADGVTFEVVARNGFDGDPRNLFVLDFEEFDGFLYASVLNGSTGGEIWRSADGAAWERVVADGFGSADNGAISSMTVFDGYLYAGTWSTQTACCGTELWRTRDPMGDWEMVADGFGGGITNSDIATMLVHDGVLYLAIENWTSGVHVARSYDGETFEMVVDDGFGDVKNANAEGLIAYKGDLYVGTWRNGGPRLYRAPVPGDAGTWEPAGDWSLFLESSFSLKLYRYGEYLIAAVANDLGEGGALYRSVDGENWETIMREGFGNKWLNYGSAGHVLFDGALYMGTYTQLGTLPISTGTQVWRLDPPQNDLDNDGVAVNVDNCPTVFNPDQFDFDKDGLGAACDFDDANGARPGPEVCDAEAGGDCGPCLDADGDGYSPQGGRCGALDCDDAAAAVHPGAADPCDGVDEDCDGADGVDRDQDGFAANCRVMHCDQYYCGADCNDANPRINPAAQDISGNAVDENCNGWADLCGAFSPAGAGRRAAILHYGMLCLIVAGARLAKGRRREGRA
ncbi:MAG: putative metal-binding motif-containing protein, partial [Myxococcales bacterium]|nr:putative metal-binding motif-containing protein [Myxococcales bacterium]